MAGTPQQHFLVVTYPAQGHLNPAIHLANRLANTTGSRITFSTAVSAHRKMFPNLDVPDQEVIDGPITFAPFSDGYDEGFTPGVDDINDFFSKYKSVGPQSLSSVIDGIDSRGRRVDCVIYTFMMSWVAEVARGHGIPSAQYWIQPATVFAIYYHAFRGYDELIAAHCKDPLWAVELPGLPPLRIRDLPSFLTAPNGSDDPNSVLLDTVKEPFSILDRELEQTKQKQKVLVNTFDELEVDALSSVDNLDLIAVGPILQSFPKDDVKSPGFDLFKPDEKRYIEWLDSKPEKSVVFVSFGSLAVLEKRQMEEMLKGLKASGRPYLWVVRKDCRYEGDGVEENGEMNAMVVAWCSQVRVLSHLSVGCFVTHCGWNSTLESLMFGVPTVGVPQWSDQGTNAMLMETAWGTGVRGRFNGDGVLDGDELRRCLDLVLGEDDEGVEIRRKASMWKKKAIQAVSEGGSSDRNLRAFVDEIAIKSD